MRTKIQHPDAPKVEPTKRTQETARFRLVKRLATQFQAQHRGGNKRPTISATSSRAVSRDSTSHPITEDVVSVSTQRRATRPQRPGTSSRIIIPPPPPSTRPTDTEAGLKVPEDLDRYLREFFGPPLPARTTAPASAIKPTPPPSPSIPSPEVSCPAPIPPCIPPPAPLTGTSPVFPPSTSVFHLEQRMAAMGRTRFEDWPSELRQDAQELLPPGNVCRRVRYRFRTMSWPRVTIFSLQ